MRRVNSLILSLGAATMLAACSTTPDRIDELETARATVAQVENSPRVGVAAENVSEARRALETANRLVETSGDLDDIRFHASIATKHAQIANEKILAAQAREEIDEGKAERQRVLIQAREREAQRRAAEAQLATAQADEAQQRAQQAEQRAGSLEDELRELQAKPTDRGMVLTLSDVLFETDKSTLKPGAFAAIDRVAEVLKDSQDRKVTIEGHTDSVGSEEYNHQLSERRARAVQAALMERGVSGDQITVTGKGETFPVATNDTAAGRQQNRRVELVFQQEPASRTASDSG